MTSSGLRASPRIRRRASAYSFCLCSSVLTGRARLSPFSWPLADDDGLFKIRIAGTGITHWDPIHALSSTVTLQPLSEVCTGAQSLDISLIFWSNWNTEIHLWITVPRCVPIRDTSRFNSQSYTYANFVHILPTFTYVNFILGRHVDWLEWRCHRKKRFFERCTKSNCFHLAVGLSLTVFKRSYYLRHI